MKKIIGIIIIIIIAFFLFGKDSEVDKNSVVLSEISGDQKDVQELDGESTGATLSESESGADTVVGNGEVALSEIQSEVKEFTVTGTPFEFSMKEIRVAKGDTVRIVFKNGGGTHDWKVDEFNAATKVIKTGEEDVVEFVADKAGTFEYYCSVGNHRAQGMVGNLIVE